MPLWHDLSKVTQLGWDGARSWTQATWLWSQCPCPSCSPSLLIPDRTAMEKGFGTCGLLPKGWGNLVRTSSLFSNDFMLFLGISWRGPDFRRNHASQQLWVQAGRAHCQPHLSYSRLPLSHLFKRLGLTRSKSDNLGVTYLASFIIVKTIE